jgi:hypothetical protein
MDGIIHEDDVSALGDTDEGTLSAPVLVPLDEKQVERIVQTLIMDATEFMDSEISPIRIRADQYFQGLSTLPYEKGRSKLVVSKVRDAVKSVVPSIARIFTQNDVIAEFSSDDEEDEKICQEQTIFVNSVYDKYNGYNALISGTTDALKARVGIVKVWLEQKELSSHQTMETVHMGDLPMLTEDGTSQITEQSDADEAGMVSVTVTRKGVRKIWHLDPIPPESFFVDSAATSLEDFKVIGTRVNMTVYEARRIGLPLERLLELAGTGGDASSQMDYERNARTTYSVQDYDSEGLSTLPDDPLSAELLICEAWLWLDADGDGVAELRHVFTGGTNFELIHEEVCHHVPLGLYKTDLQPHVFFPISLAEDLCGDQDAATSLTRGILDNTQLVNSPRTEVNENEVNLEDVKNNEIGAIIRVKQMGQVSELVTPFVAGQTLPVLQYLNDVSEQRSGVTRLSQGLSPDALQSTTAVAANAAVMGADSRLEMMARNIGETGVKSMFLAILRVAMYELRGPQSVRTVNGYTEVRPDLWHDQVNISVNVGLGNGRLEEKGAVLGAVAAIQQQVVLKLGLANPIAGWTQLRNTYRTMLRLSGIKNTQDFFPMVPPAQLQQIDQMEQEKAAAANQPPQVPDVKGAAEVKAQADMQINQAKIQSQMMADMQKMQAEQQKTIAEMQQKHTLEMTSLRAEMQTKLVLGKMDYDAKEDAIDAKFAVDSKKVELDAQVKRETQAQMAASREVVQ